MSSKNEPSIPLHPKYGVNPTLCVCILCGQETGEIALLGNNYKGEAPKHMVASIHPCEKCEKKYLKKGVMFVEVLDEQRKNPTGRVCVVKDAAFKRIFKKAPPVGKIVFCDYELFDRLHPPAETLDKTSGK